MRVSRTLLVGAALLSLAACGNQSQSPVAPTEPGRRGVSDNTSFISDSSAVTARGGIGMSGSGN